MRDRQGAVLSLSVERLSDDGDYRLQQRELTGKHDQALGEPCEIWTATSRFLNAQSCETADGIQLWIRHPSQGGRADLSSARAVSIERRTVRSEEVRPPSDFFRLAPWPKGSAGGEGGYEVRLVSTTRGKPRVQVRRRQGARWSGHRDSDDGTHLFSAADGSSRFSYTYGVDGRPLALEVALWSASPFSEGSGEKWVRLPRRRARTVLGERCTWQEEASIRSTDAHYECRTADGIPLMLEDDWHWDSITDIYKADSLVRRPLTEADMAPPPASVDWAAWGVAPTP